MANTVIMDEKGELKGVAITLGVIFIIIGLLAFISNPIVGPAGFFLTNNAHDLVHILSGAVLLLSGFMGESASLRTLQVFGIIYALIAIIGLIMGGGMLLGFLEINVWDNILHIIIAIVALYFGFGASMAKPKI